MSYVCWGSVDHIMLYDGTWQVKFVGDYYQAERYLQKQIADNVGSYIKIYVERGIGRILYAELFTVGGIAIPIPFVPPQQGIETKVSEPSPSSSSSSWHPSPGCSRPIHI